jgi:cytidylate kinase
MPVVTIARQRGSGGEAVAAQLAQRLNARLLDHDLLLRASERSGIPVSNLEALDERGRSMLKRPIDLVRLVPLPPINPDLPDVTGDRYPPTGPVQARGEGLLSPAYWATEAYASLLARTMQAEAADGDVVIVGRCGNEALAATPGALHVLVLAGQRTRLERIMATDGVNAFDALDLIKESDRRQAAYARQFYKADWLDPAHYDLVVNTDKLDTAAAVEVIATVAPRVGVETGAAHLVGGVMAPAAAH